MGRGLLSAVQWGDPGRRLFRAFPFVIAVTPKFAESAMRAALEAIGLRGGDDSAKMLFESEECAYDASHRLVCC